MDQKKHFEVPMIDDDDSEISERQFSKFRSNSTSTSKRSVIVSGRQKGNPLLRFLRNVPWEWGDIPGDYQIGASCCLLFLSAKYHKLHSEYIHQRFKKIGKTFANQILLFLIDVEEPKDVLREMNSMCFLTDCWTLILCWSYEECAEYVESLKIYENKPTEFLMVNEKTAKNEKPDDFSILVDLLTTIRSVTKTDAENLIDAFGSLINIVEASVEQLALCKGVGLLKAKRIYDAFGQPFSSKNPANDVDLAIKEVELDNFDAEIDD
uniref:DNA excision repair protein ERCC-1 n=1 Tax=Romanomermis culicivorax TaxID=13658 RepID=A0A915HKH0_ROMCU